LTACQEEDALCHLARDEALAEVAHLLSSWWAFWLLLGAAIIGLISTTIRIVITIWAPNRKHPLDW